MNVDGQSGNEKGKLFENQVAEIYEGLGYKVTQNIRIREQQIDLVAERFAEGLGSTKLIIECKYRENGNVSNQEVFNFISFIKAIKDEEEFTKGVIVTNTNFTSQARSIGVKNILTLTLQELESSLFMLKPAFSKLIRDYKSSSIHTEYLSLSGVQEERTIDDLEGWIERKIITHKSNSRYFVTVLADYGAGKTTLFRRLEYKFAQRYVTGESKIKPFYIELKYFNQSKDLDVFLVTSFKKNFGIEIKSELLWSEMRSGNLLLLLDGFDEMTPQISKKTRVKNFKILSQLIVSCRYSLLSCRPSYFVSNKEYLEILEELNLGIPAIKFGSSLNVVSKKSKSRIEDFYREMHSEISSNQTLDIDLKESIATVYLKELSQEKIEEYFKRQDEEYLKTSGKTWREVLDHLLSIYDLSDLMRKPILLKMIATTALIRPEELFSNKREFGPSLLYEYYTDLKLQRDYEKGETRQFLTKDQRREFAEAIAVSMFDSNKLEVTYSEIEQIIKGNKSSLRKISQRVDSLTIEEVTSDVRLCSFITLTVEDNFKFEHKSYMEFFSARYLKRQIKFDGFDDRFSSKMFPKEVLYFIGAFAMVEPELRKLIIKSLYQGNKGVLARNICALFLYSSHNHNEVVLSKQELIEIDLQKIKFSRSHFSEVSFENSKVNRVTFSRSVFKDFVLNDVRVLNSKFVENSGNISGNNLHFIECDFSLSTDDSLNISGEAIELSKCEFGRCQLVISGQVSLSECTFVDSNLTFIGGKDEFYFSNSSFQNCQVTFVGRFEKLDFKSVSFLNSQLVGLKVLQSFASDLEIRNCQGLIVSDKRSFQKHLKESNGLVMLYGSKELVVVRDNSIEDEKLRFNILQFYTEESISNEIDNYLETIDFKLLLPDEGDDRRFRRSWF